MNGLSTQQEFRFGAVLKEYRRKNKLSQPGLAELMNVSRNTITNWENDRARPEVEAIRTLCTMLNIPLYELFGLKDNFQPSSEDQNLLAKYHALSPSGQHIVNRMIDAVADEELNEKNNYLIDNCIILEAPATPAAAGLGCDFFDNPTDYIFVKKNGYNDSADAVIRVSGASMEPLYYDGDLVYVSYAKSARDGDIVIYSTADGAVIKQLFGHKLYSLNKALPYGKKSEDDNVRIIGKVLGKVSPLELLNKDETALIEEVKADEVREFKKRRIKLCE